MRSRISLLCYAAPAYSADASCAALKYHALRPSSILTPLTPADLKLTT
jgi:hypothetical protein